MALVLRFAFKTVILSSEASREERFSFNFHVVVVVVRIHSFLAQHLLLVLVDLFQFASMNPTFYRVHHFAFLY